ncbi:hypothetical protein ACFSJY_08895 [Thalassotalea euphylliae]|uniref:hypothetical protein n=1 Tax=Thalassotalea euphylliae TaxID=1655234 RepID=UPI00362D7141
MALLVILACVFLGIGLMVFFGEKYGKPLTSEEQGKYSKIIIFLVMGSLVIAIINQLVG